MNTADVDIMRLRCAFVLSVRIFVHNKRKK